MKVCAVINNKRIFFSGKFRITYKTGKNGGLKMIQKSFSVEGGESRKVQFAIPLLSESQEYIVSVCDSSGKICLKANTVVNADTDTTGIYVGVLSDTRQNSVIWLIVWGVQKNMECQTMELLEKYLR